MGSSIVAPRDTLQVGRSLQRLDYSQLHMGVRVNVALYAKDQAQAETAAKAAFARFAELEQIMSDYRPDSELMQLCARAGQGPQKVSDGLAGVLRFSQEVAARSNGAFDVTCGPVVQLWREARKTRVMPSLESLNAAKAVVGWNLLTFPSHETADLAKPGMRLDLGGIAKGYACDEAIVALKKSGIERAMVEAGGDIVVSKSPPGKIGWRIAQGGSELWLQNQAISTSGDRFQFVRIGGKRYSHIVDPRTGLGLTNQVQVTVIAPAGITTDALATACCVLDREAATRLVSSYGAKVFFGRSQ